MTVLDEFKDGLSKVAFGMTKAEAHAKGVCTQCREPAIPKCYSDAGRNEYSISGLCEQCFDALFEEPNHDTAK